MVARVLSIFLLLPLFIFSAEFTASVNHNPVYLGENFTLSLTLKGATAKSHPTTEGLQKAFSITSQQQFHSTSIVNSQLTSTVTWRFSLFPHRQGEVILPPISIETSEGLLTTEPIVLQINKKSDAESQKEEKDVIIKTEVSNPKPYKNEPFTYTVKLISKSEMANIQTKKLQIDDAIVETNGETKVYQKIVDGINFNVIEFAYLITPLKGEALTIPPSVIQGLTPSKMKKSTRSHLRDDFGLLSMMQGFEQLKPFAIATEETTVDVQPAISGVTPWLPAKSVILEEIWDDSQLLQVGEPLTRGFKIIATGVKSSQLPPINERQAKNGHFKVYADKPELNDKEKNHVLQSERKELYTLIPQKSGDLELPEVSLTWWDVTKNEKAVITLPARTLHILPGVEKSHVAAAEEQKQQETISPPIALEKDNTLLYKIIGMQAILLVFTLGLLGLLFIKLRKLTSAKSQKSKTQIPVFKADPLNHSYEKYKRPQKKEKQEKLPDLNPT